jgi:serine/threonine-protein kinase
MQAVAESINWEQPTGDADTGLTPGSIVGGRYRLDAVIGQGGMATVWRGHDERLDRTVAVKIAVPAAGDHAHGYREERVSSALQHPNIVSIFDAGEIPEGQPGGGSAFIVLEFVEGTTAQSVAPLPWREAVRIVSQAAEGLAAAHERGIVHCDVKPGNLLIDRSGRVLVADFGVAAPAESEVGDFVHGSPAYIAPERLRGEPPDPRADVYGLGGVLAYLLTGRRPDDGRRIQPWAGCPRWLDEVVMRARAEDPAVRHADAREFRLALEQAEREIGSPHDADSSAPRTIRIDRRAIQASAPDLPRRVISRPASARTGPANGRLVPRRAGALTTSRDRGFRPQSRAGSLAVAFGLAVVITALATLLVRDVITVAPAEPGMEPAIAAAQMPDLEGVNFAAAIDALTERGLIVERVEVVYGPGPLNQVVAQAPEPGANVDSEDEITLVVRTGR